MLGCTMFGSVKGFGFTKTHADHKKLSFIFLCSRSFGCSHNSSGFRLSPLGNSNNKNNDLSTKCSNNWPTNRRNQWKRFSSHFKQCQFKHIQSVPGCVTPIDSDHLRLINFQMGGTEEKFPTKSIRIPRPRPRFT